MWVTPKNRHRQLDRPRPKSANSGSRQPYSLAVSVTQRSGPILAGFIQKKRKSPLDQPIGCHCADRVGHGQVEPVDCSLDEGRPEAERVTVGETAMPGWTATMVGASPPDVLALGGKPSGLGPPPGAAFLFNNPSDPRFFEQSLEFNSVDTSLSKSFPSCSVSTKAIAHGLVRRETR